MYTDINKADPEWSWKTEELGRHIRKDIIKNFRPASKKKNDQSTHLAADKPVKITANEEANQ